MDATYVGANSFSVTDDRTLEFVNGRRVKITSTVSGTDVYSYADVVSSSYSDPNTTVVIDESNLTSDLNTVLYGVVEPGPNGSLPNHDHSSTEGMGSDGVSFLYLSDTPTTYSGAEGQYLRATASGTEWVTLASGVQTLLELTDTPSTYYDSTGSYLVTTESGVEFVYNGRWFVDYDAPTEAYGRLDMLYLDAFYKDVYQKRITTHSGTIATNQSNTFSIDNYTTYYDYLAIDGDYLTYWCSAGDDQSWWGYEFTDRPRVIAKITIQASYGATFSSSRCPTGFKVMAGNSEPTNLAEAEAGVELFEYKAAGVPDYPDHHTSGDLGIWSDSEIKEWEFNNETLYTHYWILMWDKDEATFTRGADYAISEIGLFESVSVRWNRIGSVDAPHWFFGSGVPTEDVPIGAIDKDLYFNEDSGNVYEKSSIEGHPIIHDDFYGTVLDTTKWSTNIADNASVTVDGVLNINNITGDLHSGAHVSTVNSFPKEGNYILNLRWFAGIDDHYDAGCGPHIKFCKPDAGRDGSYGTRIEQFFGVMLCQAGAFTTERTAFRLSDATTNTNLVAGNVRSTETISIDESIWHDLEITIDCDTRRFTIDLDYGVYNFYFDVNQTSWDSIGDSFVIEFGSTDYNKTNTESFDDFVLRTTTSGYWALTSNMWQPDTASTFLDLTDTPTTYSGVEGQYLRATASGTEWAAVVGGVQTLLELTDTPSTYSGTEGAMLISTGSGTEFTQEGRWLAGGSIPPTVDLGISGNYYLDEVAKIAYKKNRNITVPAFYAKSVIIEIVDTYGTSYTGCRSVEFKLDGVLVAVTQTDYTAYCSHSTWSEMYPWKLFDTSLSKIGPESLGWFVSGVASIWLSVVFDTEVEFDEVVVNNYHNNGSIYSYGIKDTKMYISSDSITTHTYGDPISNSTEIFDGTIAAHVASNVVDDQILDISDALLGQASNTGWDDIGTLIPVSISGTEDKYLRSTGSGIEWDVVSGDIQTFLDLSDTPAAYDVDKYLRSTVTGTEWSDVSANLVDLNDTPAAYSEGKYLRSLASGTEWSDVSANLIDLNDTPSTYDYGKALISTASGTEWGVTTVTTVTGTILYGTSEPPSAAEYVDGTLFFKYVN